MRTLKTIILMAALLLAYTYRTHAQTQPFNSSYRDVYWMHGINGDETSMQALADTFCHAYQINSYHPKYPSIQGIDNAAYYWRNFNFGRRPDNFVVTHSMGGLVARYYDQHYAAGNQFGGLITMVAPHRGSEFANSFDNGMLKSFFDGALNDGIIGFQKAVAEKPLLTLVLGFCDGLITNLDKELEKLHPGLTQMLKDFIKKEIQNGDGSFWKDILNKDNIDPAVKAALQGPGYVTHLFVRLTVNNIVAQLQGFSITIITKAANYIFGDYANGEYIGKHELKYDSPIINSINSGAAFHNTNTINIVGKAEGNVGFKLLSSALSGLELNNYGRKSIGKIDDNKLARFINEFLIPKSEALSSDFNTVANLSGVSAALNFLTGELIGMANAIRLLSKRSTCKEISAAFNRQAYFWRYTFESRYEACLGNKYYTTSTETYYERVWVDDGPGHGAKPIESHDGPIDFIEFPIIGDDRPGSDRGHWEYIPRTYIVTHTHTYESDGIVTVPSQKGWQASKTLEINNVDHESVKRSKNTVAVYHGIFKGNHVKFFKTDERKPTISSPSPTEPAPSKPIVPKPKPIIDPNMPILLE